MEIKEVDYNSIKELIKSFQKSDKNELEVRLHNNNSNNSSKLIIDHDTFTRVRNYLVFDSKVGGLGLKYDMKTTLDITNREGNIRISIDGKDNIKKFWLMNKLDDITFTQMSKTRIKNVDITDYNTRISLSSEEPLTSSTKDTAKNLDILRDDAKVKYYRLKNRYYVYDSSGLFRFDLSSVKSDESTTFLKSNVVSKAPQYEIEIECIQNKEDIDVIAKRLIYNTSLILSLMQNNNIITKISDIKEVIESYGKTIQYKNSNNKKFRGNKYENSYNPRFIAANPVTIHPINLVKSNTNINILEPYAITPKADGDRYLLYIVQSSNKDIHGNIYMIDIGLNVKYTNYSLNQYAGSIFEGEYISDNNIIYLYDTLFYKGSDVRKNKFNRSLTKRDDKSNKSRVEYLEEFLHNNKETIGEAADNKLVITKKQILYSNGEDVFEKSREIWHKKNTYDFNIDGLIYIPLNDYYPIRGGGWHSLLKWKPSEYNSIDFLVRTLKDEDANDIIKPLVVKDKNKEKILRYKTATLYVGSNNDTFNNISKKWIKNVIPKEFNPENLSEEQAERHNRAKIFIDENDMMVFIDPISKQQYVLKDDTIVEFYYNRDTYGWIPLRNRNDKTEQYKKGNKIFGNFESTANDVWKSIVRPVTMRMLFDGEIDATKIEVQAENVATNKSYYKCVEEEDYNHTKRLPMQNFHNIYVKKTLIYNYSPCKLGENKSNKQEGKLLDLACGKGGDLSKWKNAKLKEVVAIDISKPCVEYGKNFFKTYPKPKPAVRYIWGDTSKLIWPEQDAGKSTMDKQRMKEWIPNKNDFNMVSCQFCIHYYFENEMKLRTLIQNVSDNITMGGYFIGTCFNGKNIFNMLKSNKMVEGKIDDKVIWKIEKDYKIRTFNEEKPHFGQKIKVYIDSIGETHTEYLVNFTYFEKIMKKYGFELVEYKGFEQYYVDFEKDKNKSKGKNMKELSQDEKELSFLNYSFVFKKTGITSDKEYKNLVKLIEKTT
jgi:hypothetical protein